MPERTKRILESGVAPASGAGRAPEVQPPERRSNARFPFTAGAEVVELQSKTKIAGRTTDLGPGGCYVDAITAFPLGTQVSLQLSHDGRSFQAQASVIYAQVGLGMGLAFTEVAADQLEVLRLWMQELSGGAPLHAEPAEASSPEPLRQYNERHVLNQLISLLIRKGALTEEEGAALLRELFR